MHVAPRIALHCLSGAPYSKSSCGANNTKVCTFTFTYRSFLWHGNNENVDFEVTTDAEFFLAMLFIFGN